VVSRAKSASDAWGSLLRVHAALVPRFDQVVRAATGLPLAWYDVLLELAHASEGRLRVGELGDRVVLSRSRVSRVVDEIAARGLVAREDDATDRRAAFAVLTPAGRACFEATAAVYVRAIEDQFAAKLTGAELRQLTALLERIITNLEAERPAR
jgi:DNA-binding MarR family transcriptional regulator